MRITVSALIAPVLLACMALQAFALEGKLTAPGGVLALRLSDGRTLAGEALAGLTIRTADRGAMRIEEIVHAETPGGPMSLYRISRLDAAGEPAGNICYADPDGRRLAIAMPDGRDGFRFTCSSGAEGKCILMGYRPWAERDGVPLRGYFQACIHMFRADYGGDGHPSTRDGTAINFWDRLGIQKADFHDGMEFEAAWGADGAVCVAHPRVPQNIGLSDLSARYPALAGDIGPEACTAARMQADPKALLFNRSKVAPHG